MVIQNFTKKIIRNVVIVSLDNPFLKGIYTVSVLSLVDVLEFEPCPIKIIRLKGLVEGESSQIFIGACGMGFLVFLSFGRSPISSCLCWKTVSIA